MIDSGSKLAVLALVFVLCFQAGAVLMGQTVQYHVVNANEWLYPDTPMPDSPVRAVDLHAARGARAGFQVLLRGTKAGDQLSCHFEGQPAPEIYQLIDVKVPENSGPPCSAIPPDQPKPEYVVRKAPYRVYEALRPLRDGARARGATEALYVSFGLSADAEPGQRKGLLRIQAAGQTAEIGVTLTVHPARVPTQGHLRVTNWFSTGHMARLHQVQPWSEPHWDMLRLYAQMMRRGRQTDFIPVRPEQNKVGDALWEFDFSRTERMIRMFLDEGFTHIELPHIASHDRRKEAVARFVVNVDGTRTPGTSHEAYEFLAQYLTAWAQMLRRNGWYDRATQHVVDEPSPKDFAEYRIMAGTVRKFLPGIPLIDALGEPELDGAVDIWVPLSESYENHRESFEAHRRRGDTIWFYTCCAPSGFHLNRFIDTELLRTRLLHWANWRYRLDGYLHWGLNQIIAEQDPFENTCPPHGPYGDFHLPPGDSHLVYPGEDGPWSSVRFEAMGAGIEDYELLRIVAARDEKLADEIATQLVRGFTDYDSTVSGFESAHRRLLEEASKATGTQATPDSGGKPGDVLLFDDFDGPALDAVKWVPGLHQWGKDNRGVVPENLSLRNIVDEGRSITVLDTEAHGDLYKGPVKGIRSKANGFPLADPRRYERVEDGTRVGGLVWTRQRFGPARYEIRMKNLPLPGGCSCIWNYYEGQGDYTEIDIEMPANGTADLPNWSNWAGLNTYYPGPEHINEKVHDTGAPQNDGRFHVYRWDWYDGKNGPPRVEFYLDGRLLHTSTSKIPKSPAQLWVGNWPAVWSGSFRYDTQHLYVDWVKITRLGP